MINRLFLTFISLLLVHNIAVAQESFTLEQAIDYALKNSSSLKMRSLDILEAEQSIKELKSRGMPTVSGTVGYQYFPIIPQQPLEDFISPIVVGVLNNTVTQMNPIPLGDPTFFEVSFAQKHNIAASIDARAVVFDGSYLAALKAARLYKEFVNTGVAISEQEIRNNVTKAYMNVLILDKNKETIEKNIETLEKSLFETKELYKEGFIEELDVDRLELSLNNLMTERGKLLQVENLSKNLLKFQMDYPMDNSIMLEENLETIIGRSKIDDVDLEDEFDVSQRPEYLQISKGIELQDIQLESVQKTNWPSVTAFANLGETLARNELFDNDQPGWLPSSVLGLNVNVPIYDGGLRKSQIEKSKLATQKALIERDNFERAVELQVSNARLQYINAKSTLESTEKSLALAEKIFDKTQIKFREGVGSSVELTQAEAALYNEQSIYINALYDLLSAKIDLDIALGKI